MANYAIFDEQYYLAQYPWVKPAIDAGIIKSGKEHFEKFGQAGGLTKISRYFDEDTYLAANPDLQPFVRTVNPNAPFATGLDHFIQFGYDEGQRRASVSPEYNESFYLANNSELQPFIQNGTFKSGYQHFIQFGAKEGRFGTSFFEPEYLKENPDIVPFVNSGALKTGREHFFNFGKNEPSRSATFVGSRSNDIITGAGGGNAELIGVEVGIDRNGNRQYESFGTNEFDVLTGSPGVDTFVLGVPAAAQNSSPTPLYTGNGQATIRNFDIENDFIQLQGTSLSGYSLTPVGNNLSIQRFGDVLGVIEGGATLGLTFQESNGNGTFLIG
ncbi:calcium-binding protein [Microcoleus sp. LEGE 07076]|uniref:calcium-binding protein n=1 Tax=Microcoleus sp. LEGE 07076 TaxID=915322 RepID=UPI001880D18C|nr:calcium-binding protein [Microcoleus sp. LEGE 07076]MBE9184486.1 calcium-binding protein [Microcoleus sp. LEGE 07076]